MNSGSDAADQMMRQGLQLSESAVKLTALGAKNLAALCLALANENHKLAGKSKMTTLLKSGKELSLFDVKESDLPQFGQLAKQYGVLFSVIKNSKDGQGNVDVLTHAEDVSKLNRILDKLNYAQPKEVDDPKKASPRAPSEMPLGAHEPSSKHGVDMDTMNRSSIIDKLKHIKLRQDIPPMEPILPRKGRDR